MAAAEYYLGSEGAKAYLNQQQYPPQSQPHFPYQQMPQQSNVHLQSQSQLQQPQGPYFSSPAPPHGPAPHYNQTPQSSTPQLYTGGTPYQPNQGQQQNGFLSVPTRPTRSHSQPPRVHFKDEKYESDSSTPDESDSSRRRRHRRHRHHHRHHRSHSRSPSGYDDRGYNDSHHSRSHHHSEDRKSRDTFLGAGGGALIGDAILPGLGTIGGMLLGGYGGREHAKKASKRSRSSVDDSRGHYGR